MSIDMSWFPMVTQGVGSILQFMGANKAADAAERQGAYQRQAALYQAAQMTQQAGQEQAAAQRAALDQRRMANLIASRAVAVAGASGGGVTDPTVQKIIGDIQGEGAYRAALRIYQGDESARQLRMGAEAKTYEGGMAGENAESLAGAYRTKAWGGLAVNGASLYSKYGGGGFSGGIDMSKISAGGHAGNYSYAPDAFPQE